MRCRIDGYSLDSNTKSIWLVQRILNISFLYVGMSKVSDDTKATIKKQTQRIHSISLM